MPSTAPTDREPVAQREPRSAPDAAHQADSGQLASAVPSAPTAMGSPDQVFVPVMLAAMMLPMAIMIEWPALPQTWAANSVAISVVRVDAKPGGAAGVLIEWSVYGPRATG